MFRFVFHSLGIVSILILSACGNNKTDAPKRDMEAPAATAVTEPSPPVEIQSENYNWQSVSPSIAVEGPPTTLNLAEGYVFALLDKTPVSAGDTVIADLNVTGDAGRILSVLVQRHCDAANGDEGQSDNFELTGQAQSFTVSHTFAGSYSCVRVAVRSQDSAPMKVTVNDLRVTVNKAASSPATPVQ